MNYMFTMLKSSKILGIFALKIYNLNFSEYEITFGDLFNQIEEIPEILMIFRNPLGSRNLLTV